MFSFTDPKAIWGGIKKTGVGRSHGPYGLLEISNIKFVSMDFDKRRDQNWWYPYGIEKRALWEKVMVLLHHRSLIKRFKAMTDMLRELEWGYMGVCFVCGSRNEKAGHYPKCDLAALLGESK